MHNGMNKLKKKIIVKSLWLFLGRHNQKYFRVHMSYFPVGFYVSILGLGEHNHGHS